MGIFLLTCGYTSGPQGHGSWEQNEGSQTVGVQAFPSSAEPADAALGGTFCIIAQIK